MQEDRGKVLAAGDDPAQIKREAKLTKALGAANTFEAVARQWWDHWKGPKTPRHADDFSKKMDLSASDAWRQLK